MTREDAKVIDRDIVEVGLVFAMGARALAGVAMGVRVLARVGTIFSAGDRAGAVDVETIDLAEGAVARKEARGSNS